MSQHQVWGCDADKPGSVPALEPLKCCLGCVLCQLLALRVGTSQAHCLFQQYCLYSRRFWNSAWARASGQASLKGKIQDTAMRRVNASLLTKNGSDRLHPPTPLPPLGPEGSSYSKEEEIRPLRTADRNVPSVHGLSAAMWCLEQIFAIKGGPYDSMLKKK